MRAGYDVPQPIKDQSSSQELIDSQTSGKFISLMRAAMLLSFYKYGDVSAAYPDKLNALDSMQMRINKYKETKMQNI